jgi:3-deoxy-D-arabino-heptulosonate 7-phosphate (DAHP) synthase
MSILHKSKKPLLIAGPCSAETEEQVMQTAVRLFRTGRIDIFRAGIWKPRTRPGAFEGVGDQRTSMDAESKGTNRTSGSSRGCQSITCGAMS